MSDDVNNRFIWLGGKVVRLKDATINVLAPTSQFALNVFEGIRCYWNKDQKQLYAFRLEDHLKRLKNSQRLIQMEDTYTIEELEKAFRDVVVANEYREDIAVRQTLFVDGFGSWSARGPVNMFVSPIPKAKTSAEYNKKGLNCCISSWQRINDNSLSPRIKCGANYMNSRMAQLEALKNGYDTAIFMNSCGKVAEGPGSCLFIVRNNELITPLLTDSVLESITRDTVLRIARDVLHFKVTERSIDRTELYMCDEAFLCGSAMEVTPIIAVDQYPLHSADKDGITAKIHQEYLKVVTGENEDYKNWLTPLY